MAKVIHPLFSGTVRGSFGKYVIYRRGGVVTKYFVPRDPKSAAQLAQRAFFLEHYVGSLTQEQADLLYAAILHLHDDVYSPLAHGHDHGGLAGLGDDDHGQYYNQARGDARYLQSVPQQDHGGLAGLGDDDHTQYLTVTRGDALYSLLAHLHGATYAPIAKGVTNGDAHNHVGGAGGVLYSYHFMPGHGLNATIPASTTMFTPMFYFGLYTSRFNFSFPRGGTLRNFRFTNNTAQPGTGSLVGTVEVNNAASALTATVAAGGAISEASDLIHSVVVNGGNTVTVSIKNNATSASAWVGGVSFEMQVATG